MKFQKQNLDTYNSAIEREELKMNEEWDGLEDWVPNTFHDYFDIRLTWEDSFLFPIKEVEVPDVPEVIKGNKNYLEKPIYERKYLYIVRRYSVISDVIQIKLSQLPENIEFLGDQPTENTMYVVHPYKSNVYVPLLKNERYLLDDKLTEFRWFVQNLGAKEICLMNGNSSESYTSSKQSHFESGEYGEIGLDGMVACNEQHTKESYYNDYYRNMINQVFKDNNKPAKLAEDLVWYYKDKKWQMLYKQVMNGGVNLHHEIMESGKLSNLNTNDKIDITSKIKLLRSKAGLSLSQEEETSITKTENIMLHILVKW